MAQSSNKFVLREFSFKDDYDEYASWYERDGVNPPNYNDFPNIGLVSGDMKACGFLYLTDSSFGVFALWHTNFKNTPRESYEGMSEIIKGIQEAAKSAGRSKVFCSTNNRGMIRLLESLNFTNHDSHLIAEIS